MQQDKVYEGLFCGSIDVPDFCLFDILEFVSLIQPYTRLLYRQ